MQLINRYLLIGVLVAATSLTVFQTTVAQTPAPTTAGSSSQAQEAGSVRYQIDGAASDVRILVYRGGALSRLGHNHVVSSKSASGTISLHKDFARSQLDLTLPVANLIVDDPDARSKEGEEFSAKVPDDAREGTRKNLLRKEVLDGEHHAAITLRSTAISGTRSNPQLTMRISIKGVERDVAVAAAVREEGKRLTATGEFTIKQTDFKMKPFSAALGALQVQDSLKIKFSIVCLQQE